MARKNPDGSHDPATERDTAPVTETPVATIPQQQPQWVMPRQKSIERAGSISAPMVHRHPQVRGGVCEFCGVIDGNYPSEYQYKLCPHYRGMQLRCTYCPEGKDADDVISHSTLNVAEHPNNPDTLVVWCNAYDCVDKHIKRFKRNS